MKKGLKKIIASTMVFGALMSANTVAFADTPSFSFTLTKGQKSNTESTQKHDNEQNAYVTVSSTTTVCCAPSDRVYYRSRTANGDMASDVRSQAGTGKLILPYNVLTAYKNSYYKLYVQFDGDDAHPFMRTSGKWNA